MKDFKTITRVGMQEAFLPVTMTGITAIRFCYSHDYGSTYFHSMDVVTNNNQYIRVNFNGKLYNPYKFDSELEQIIPAGRGLKYIKSQHEMFCEEVK